MIKDVKILWYNYGLIVLMIVTIIIFFMYWMLHAKDREYGTYNKMNIPKYIELVVSEKEKVIPKKSPITESKGELECRRVLETIFKVPFPKARPDFLFNKVTGHNLELDMFNPHLRLACEYNGKQHYEYNKWMHNNSHTNFHNQKYRDEIKRDVCKKLGIHLIEVPYTVRIDDIEEFIISKLKNKQLLK